MEVEEDSIEEGQIEELTKKDDGQDKSVKFAQQLESMQGSSGSKDRPPVKEAPVPQGLL